MIEVRQSEVFAKWLLRLRDIQGRSRIIARLARIRSGNLGDVKFFDGIGEVRIDAGPGYRIYFVKRGDALIILLCGGDKSTQEKDIKAAKEMAKEA